MSQSNLPVLESARVGYVLKMYPRFSETFILNEILAHEAAGLNLEIFSLRLPSDGRFHEALARVRAPVTYLRGDNLKSAEFWAELGAAGQELPGLWQKLEAARDEDVRDVYQALILARAARARGITHLHAHFGSVATTVARLAGHFAHIPYSFTAHAKDIFHDSVSADDLKRKLSDASAVVTVSEFNLAHFRNTFGKAASNVRRIYNGLDLEEFAYAAPTDRKPEVIAVGRLIEKKGFSDLIDACAILVRRGLRFYCSIIGAGPFKAELQDRIERLSLTDAVRLMGPRPQGDVMRLVQDAAVFAAPCVIGADGDRDGLPTVLLEAMALGTPCVSTDVTGIPEVLRDGQTGLMVPQHDPEALAQALDKLLCDAELRVRLATNARRMMESEFDIHRNAASQRELFGGQRRTSPSKT